MNALIDNVRQWFHDKGIIENSNTYKQIGKTQEELTETRDAVVKLKYTTHLYNDHGMYFTVDQIDDLMHEIKDGIGDTLVTMIGIAEMEYIYPDRIFNHDSQIPEAESDDSLGLLSEIQLWLLELCRAERGFAMLQILRVMVDRLRLLAQYYSFTLEECLQQAYNVISKRTGRMENGIFVKDKEVTDG